MEMREIEVLLLDDESDSMQLSLEAIMKYVERVQIHCASTVEEVMAIMSKIPIQLAFLDLELSHSDGFTLSDYIRRNYTETEIVFLTGHVDLGAKSYEYEPLDFLTKPVDVLRMERTFRKFEEKNKQRTGGSSRIMIETGSNFILLSPADIQCIAKDRYAVEIRCRDKSTIKVSYSLDYLEGILAEYGFFRTHQSYLIPIERISKVNSSKFGNTFEAVLDDGSVIPVSRGKFSKLKEHISAQSLRLTLNNGKRITK